MNWPLPMESAHPLVVHFPIALLCTSFFLDLLGTVLRRPNLYRIAMWNLALGLLGAGVAILTGLRAEALARHSFEIWQVMTLHKRLGFVVLGLGLIIFVIRLVKGDLLLPRVRILILLLSGGMIAVLAWGAHLGGRLVFEFGVGGLFGR